MRGRELSRRSELKAGREFWERNGMMFIQIHQFIPYLLVSDAFSNLLLFLKLPLKVSKTRNNLYHLYLSNQIWTEHLFFVKESWVDGWLFSCFYRSARRFARILCIRLLHATLLTRKLAFMKQWTNRGSPGRATALTNNWSISSFCKVQKQVLHWHAQWDTWQCVEVSQLRFLKAVFS